MPGISSEKAILARQARFKLYNMAKQKWPESEGDLGSLSEKLAKMMLESGIYLDANSRLVHYSNEEYERSGDTKKGSGGKKVPGKWAVIDMGNKEDLVVGGTSDPELFDSEDEARIFARGLPAYQGWHQSCFDELVIPWNATHFSFKRNRGQIFSITEGSDEGMMSANNERLKALGSDIRSIIDIEKIGDPEKIVPRGMYGTVDEIRDRVERARRSQISRRWDWVLEHRGIKDASGEVMIKRGGEDPSGKHGKHTNPGEVGLEKPVDFELVSILIDLLDSEVATIAEVLCRSHLWRAGEEDLPEEEGQSRPSLLSQEDIGCREGDDMGRVASDMIRWQFGIQPIFDSSGSQIGSLELKRLTGFVGREGWGALPDEVSEEALSGIGLLGPMVPMVDPMERSDTVSQVLSRSIDAVIFRWSEDRHSTRRGFPEDCRGVLEDGLHIVTSHDIMAFSMAMGN